MIDDDAFKKDPLMSKLSVAGHLDVESKTIDKWVARKKFPKPDMYIGRHPRWRFSTVNEFINGLKAEQNTGD